MDPRIRLLVLGGYAVFTAACIAFAVRVSVLERSATLQEAQRQSEALALALGEHLGGTVRGADVLLQDLADEIGAAGGLPRYDAAKLHQRLKLHAGRVSGIGGIVVYGADLELHASSFSPQARATGAAGREHFEAHRARDSGRLFVGKAMRGPISGANLIPVSRRLNASDGSFAGVIGASLPFAPLEAFFRRLGLEPGAGMQLVRSDGEVLLRLPVEGLRPGENLQAGELLRAAPYAVPDLPILVVLARDRDALLAPWRDALLGRGAMLALLLAATGGLAFGVLRWLRTRQAAAAEIRGAREALRESDARLAAFFRSGPIAHAIVRESDQAFVEVNEAWERTFGLRRDDVLGRTAIGLGIWDSTAQRAAFFAGVERDGAARDVAVRLRRAGAGTFEALLSASRAHLGGAPHLMISTIDVSAEVRAREAERESRERFEKLFRSSPVAHGLLRAGDGCYVDVNDAWVRVFGYSRAEAIGRTSTELGVWVDEAEQRAFVARAAERGWVHGERDRRRRRSGEIFEAVVSAETVELGGERYRLTSVMDVTAETRALQELRDSEARFATLFHSSAIPVALIDLDADAYVDVNESWERTFRYPRAAAVGRSPGELSLWPDRATRAVFLREVLARGSVRDFAVTLRDGAGGALEARVSSALVELDGHRHLVTTSVDVTPLVRALDEVRFLNETLEQRVRERTVELEAANRELEAFSYSVAHDMRAPVRAMAGFTEIVRREHAGQLDAEGRRLLERVSGAAGQLGRLIDALLELSRLMRQPVNREPLDLSALAAQVLEALRERSPGRDVETKVGPGLAASADPVLAKNLLENLLGNAWKYTAKAAAARIEFGCEGGAFFVRDNGAGFDMRHAAKLFKPFERLHGVDEFPGTGIGLATVERIVRRHGGRVWAEAAPGAGATFLFTLGAPEGRKPA